MSYFRCRSRGKTSAKFDSVCVNVEKALRGEECRRSYFPPECRSTTCFQEPLQNFCRGIRKLDRIQPTLKPPTYEPRQRGEYAIKTDKIPGGREVATLVVIASRHTQNHEGSGIQLQVQLFAPIRFKTVRVGSIGHPLHFSSNQIVGQHRPNWWLPSFLGRGEPRDLNKVIDECPGLFLANDVDWATDAFCVLEEHANRFHQY